MMKNLAVFASLALSLAAPATPAAEPAIPHEFLGDWVPQRNACQSPARLRVESSAITLVNGPDEKEYGDVSVCFSCEGGARYGGIVVWVFPNSDNTPLFARFNADEKAGVALLEIDNAELAKRFPLHARELRRCAPVGVKER